MFCCVVNSTDRPPRSGLGRGLAQQRTAASYQNSPLLQPTLLQTGYLCRDHLSPRRSHGDPQGHSRLAEHWLAKSLIGVQAGLFQLWQSLNQMLFLLQAQLSIFGFTERSPLLLICSDFSAVAWKCLHKWLVFDCSLRQYHRRFSSH